MNTKLLERTEAYDVVESIIEDVEDESKPLKTIHESIFWEDGCPWGAKDNEGYHSIDMGVDSYIWCFTGSRGAGKSTLMTLCAMYFNYLYGFRLVSNYPIAYKLQRRHGKPEEIRSEPLDFFKLFCFEHDYDNCLILLDEAPDVISHMAAQTWKNRLLNIFVRQLRKNHNSLFMGAQYFELIDKSMRTQTDILAECEDASRKYGWGRSFRGMCILLRMVDNSGLWTGEAYEQALSRMRNKGSFEDPTEKYEVFPRVLWDNDGHSAVFDSFKEFDVWESLRKVDMKLQTYAVGDAQNKEAPRWATEAPTLIEQAQNAGIITKKEMYDSFGDLTKKEKMDIGEMLHNAGATDYGTANRKYNFENFSMDKFMKKLSREK